MTSEVILSKIIDAGSSLLFDLGLNEKVILSLFYNFLYAVYWFNFMLAVETCDSACKNDKNGSMR